MKQTRDSRAEKPPNAGHSTAPGTAPTLNAAFEPQASHPPAAPTARRSAPAEPSTGYTQQRPHAQPPRQEPSFEAAGATVTRAPHFAGSPYAQFEQRSAWYRQSGPLHRNPVSRVFLMTVIFAVGAAVGLAATWWMNKPLDKPPPAAAIRKVEPVPAPAAPTKAAPASAASAAAGSASTANPGMGAVHSGTGNATPGINPGELPYDGLPPAAGLDSTPAAVQAPAATTDVGEPPPSAAIAPGTSKPIAGKPRQGPEQALNVPAAAPPLPTPPSVTKSDKPTAAAPVYNGKERAAKAQDAKVAKAAPRSRPSQKIVKDGEIERIQQQVDEELKKKSRSTDVKEVARERTEETEKKIEAHVASNGSKRAALARCERDEDSLIGREWCKWKVCNGMWGKNGCPSYEKQASTHY